MTTTDGGESSTAAAVALRAFLDEASRASYSYRLTVHHAWPAGARHAFVVVSRVDRSGQPVWPALLGRYVDLGAAGAREALDPDGYGRQLAWELSMPVGVQRHDEVTGIHWCSLPAGHPFPQPPHWSSSDRRPALPDVTHAASSHVEDDPSARTVSLSYRYEGPT